MTKEGRQAADSDEIPVFVRQDGSESGLGKQRVDRNRDPCDHQTGKITMSNRVSLNQTKQGLPLIVKALIAGFLFGAVKTLLNWLSR